MLSYFSSGNKQFIVTAVYTTVVLSSVKCIYCNTIILHFYLTRINDLGKKKNKLITAWDQCHHGFRSQFVWTSLRLKEADTCQLQFWITANAIRKHFHKLKRFSTARYKEFRVSSGLVFFTILILYLESTYAAPFSSPSHETVWFTVCLFHFHNKVKTCRRAAFTSLLPNSQQRVFLQFEQLEKQTTTGNWEWLALM